MQKIDPGRLPKLYKGAGPGTHWHTNNAQRSGFTPAVNGTGTANGLLSHILNAPQRSSFISFTTSYAVALEYASMGPSGAASPANPGYVYEVDLSQTSGVAPLIAVDPVATLALNQGGFQPGHTHNGDQTLILELAQSSSALTPVVQAGGVLGPAMATPGLRATVWAIRDAEILVCGAVPLNAITTRYDVY